jgi:dienelactone hydrolase
MLLVSSVGLHSGSWGRLALGAGLLVLALVSLPARAGIGVLEEVFVAVTDASGAERQLPVRVVYDLDAATLGVIVLSHGTFSSGSRYDAVAHHWARNGFIVALPSHRDANYAETPSSIAHMLDIVDSRVRDLIAIADQFAAIDAALPAALPPLSTLPLIAAGHSVGSQVALQVAGLRVQDPETAAIRAYAESRYCGVVLLSDPGKMAMMPPDTWQGASVPTFLVTGPDDYGLMGDGRRAMGAENIVLAAATTTSVERYLLSITAMDHQFGGLIHKSVEAEPDHEALLLFNAYSVEFLRAVADPSQPTLDASTQGRISARATFERVAN